MLLYWEYVVAKPVSHCWLGDRKYIQSVKQAALLIAGNSI